jgi:hypothetical protein
MSPVKKKSTLQYFGYFGEFENEKKRSRKFDLPRSPEQSMYPTSYF